MTERATLSDGSNGSSMHIYATCCHRSPLISTKITTINPINKKNLMFELFFVCRLHLTFAHTNALNNKTQNQSAPAPMLSPGKDEGVVCRESARLRAYSAANGKE